MRYIFLLLLSILCSFPAQSMQVQEQKLRNYVTQHDRDLLRSYSRSNIFGCYFDLLATFEPVLRIQLCLIRGDSNETALHWAARHGNISAMKQLLDHASGLLDQATFSGNSVLHTAAYYNQAEVINFLIEKGIDVNQRTVSQGTALHCAASNKAHAALFALCQHGALITAQSSAGVTPFDCAKNRKDVVAQKCLYYYSLKGAMDGAAVTPHAFFDAATYRLPIMEEFLKHPGFDINARDARGNTPLHAATSAKHGQAVRLLLNNRKTNALIKNYDGSYARDLAWLQASISNSSETIKKRVPHYYFVLCSYRLLIFKALKDFRYDRDHACKEPAKCLVCGFRRIPWLPRDVCMLIARQVPFFLELKKSKTIA